MNQTIPPISIAFMSVSALLALGAPVMLWILLKRRYKRARFLTLLMGVASFLVAVPLLESLVIGLLLQVVAIGNLYRTYPWFFVLFTCLMAGLFEETARFICFRFFLRKNGVATALAYGIGHGGIEAILIGLAVVGNLVTAAALNAGMTGGLLALVPEAGLNALIATPPLQFLMAGLERLLAVCFHIAASVLVWMAVTGRSHWGYYPLAILLHALINTPAALYQTGVIDVYIAEVVIAVLVAACCLFVYSQYQKSAQTYTALLDYRPVDY